MFSLNILKARARLLGRKCPRALASAVRTCPSFALVKCSCVSFSPRAMAVHARVARDHGLT